MKLRNTRGTILFTWTCLLLPLTFACGRVAWDHAVKATFYDQQDAFRLKAEAILREVPLIDGHNDWPMNLMSNFNGQLRDVDLDADMCVQYTRAGTSCHTDIPRLREGMLGGQFWSVFTGCNTQYKDGIQRALEIIDLVNRLIAKHSSVFQLSYNSTDIWNAFQHGKISSLLGLEGGHMISSSLGVLRMFYKLGVRYMTLTWNCNTPWADCNFPDGDEVTAQNRGLSKFGKMLIAEMNRLGMLVDLSHVSPDTMRDVLQVARAPVIFSHSSVYAICPHRRNVPDDVIKKVKSNDGVIMVNFYNKFLNCTEDDRYDTNLHPATLDTVIDHMEYIRDLIGADHIGIGSDYDGIINCPVGLEDSSKYPNLVAQMLRRGWSEDDVKKVVGLNLIRALRKNEKVSATLRQTYGADEALIHADEIPDKTCINYPDVFPFDKDPQLKQLQQQQCNGKPCP